MALRLKPLQKQTKNPMILRMVALNIPVLKYVFFKADTIQIVGTATL